MGTLRITVLLLIAGFLLAESRSRYRRHSRNIRDHHDPDEDHHGSDEDHHDSDESHHSKHHDSDENHHDSDEDHHDSDEDHHSNRKHHSKRHHDSDENHHDDSHHSKHHDSDEDHHDSDEDHHSNRKHHSKRHHDSDKDHHDSDESHSDESHSDESHSDESHHDDHHDDDHHDDDDDDHHVYRFHIGEGFGPYEYIDATDGYLKGFDVDLMREVCKAAHKECYFTLDTDEHCWHTTGAHELPGEGLLDGWYDGCLGLAPTPERLNSFNFTRSHAPNIKGALHFRSGEVPVEKDLHGKKIGFVAGWAFSRGCLSRQSAWNGNTVPDYSAIIYEDHDDLVKGLLNKEVDAILTSEAADLSNKNITSSEPWFYCSTSGPAVMVRYGDHLIDWWNNALERLISNGRYRRLCREARDKHAAHGQILCLDI